jgi:predicted transcriptional regulator
METNGIEREVLEEINKRMVVNKEELIRFLENKVENPPAVVNSVTKALFDKGLITYVNPIGQSCYAITQKGMREKYE